MKIHFSAPFSVLQPTHGPQVWPWWKLVSLSIVRLRPYPPTLGYRLWVYTRWGAIDFDLYIDRRPK